MCKKIEVYVNFNKYNYILVLKQLKGERSEIYNSTIIYNFTGED